MNIHFTRTNIWGDSQRSEIEVIFQSDKMVIGRAPIENAQKPLYMDDVCVLENRYTAVSFIEYGKWYITDKIFDFDTCPTGFLVKLVTPVIENLRFLSTMDLFVKIWITPDNEHRIFGAKMFKKVSEDGLLTENVEKKARETINELISGIQQGKIPPQFVREFTIEKNHNHMT
jgi:predicted RNA-binding protein associated with RNAse of E/G family